MRSTTAAVIVTLVLAGLTAGIGAADPPRPGSDGTGLTANESATLWSRDADHYVTESSYRTRYSGDRTLLHELANGTDITFTRPPATAATWTRTDFRDLDHGDVTVSVHPPHADLEAGRFIKDAHATVFAVHPATRGHLAPDETPLYVAPNGTLRGFVDYRVHVPTGDDTGRTTVTWSLQGHTIEAIRLTTDDEILAHARGTHTPRLDYTLGTTAPTTLTLEATIRVELKTVRRTRIRRCQRVNNSTSCWTDTIVDIDYPTETMTVSDSITVEPYALTAYPYYATYPDGDVGVAVFQTQPWQGYTLDRDGTARIRGVWRFYTARDTRWDTLVRSTDHRRTRLTSDALPVYVHAYPSRIGPRAEPVRGGPEIVAVWGTQKSSPAETIGPNVHVDAVTAAYTPSYGLAVRAATVDRDALRVAGIVHGVNATIVEPATRADRRLRRSELTVTIHDQNASRAVIRIELHDATTGAPIVLEEQPRQRPIGSDSRAGYVNIAGERVETNASGVAVVTVTQPGIYTARYHPGSWLGHDPAYVGTTATMRWHPLTTVRGWLALLDTLLWHVVPFAVAYVAGRQLAHLLGPRERFSGGP